MSKGKTYNRFTRWLFTLGPGIITAALVFGPSKMTITSKLGAEYGYSLLWIVSVAVFFMLIFTDMGARIGVAAEQSLLAAIGDKWGKIPAVLIGIGVFLVTASFQAGNSIGAGIAAAEITGTSTGGWVIVFAAAGIALLFLRDFYRILQRLMIVLVALMLISFVFTLVLSDPNPAAILQGFLPGVPPQGSEGLIIAFIASCFSIVGAFYQSYLVREKAKFKSDAGETDAGSGSGMGIMMLGFMSAVLIICAAAVLNVRGIHVKTVSDMGQALEPLFGQYAVTLFLIGLFAASFSSLVGNATVGGTLLSDALGYGSSFKSRATRSLIALVMVCGAVIALIYGGLPLSLIVFAQSITIFLVPFIGLAMYSIGNKQEIMGKRVNSEKVKWFGGMGLLLLFALALYNGYYLFIK